MARSVLRFLFHRYNVHQIQDAPARQILERVRRKLDRGDEALIVGLGAAGHNSGVGLVRVTSERGIELLGNDEEERFTGIKHCSDFPVHSLVRIARSMALP